MKTPFLSLCLALLAPLAAHAEDYRFRALLGPGGAVLADPNFWDVGPSPGETAAWNRLGIRLQNAPDDLLTGKKVGASHRDQYGGKWTVRRIPVMFRDPRAVCDGQVRRDGITYDQCYYLIMDFAGYVRDERTGAIVRAKTKEEAATEAAQSMAGRMKSMLSGFLGP